MSTPKEKQDEHNRGQRDYNKSGGQVNINPITEIFHPTYRPSGSGKSYGKGWGNAKKSSGDCFVSTACVEAKGLSDNCLELEILREFRDNIMIHLPGGMEGIKTYYAEAPRIINRIKLREDKEQIFTGFFDVLVRRSVDLIVSGKHEEAFDYYKSKIAELKATYS